MKIDQSAQSLKDNVSKAIDAGDLDQALHLVHDFVEFIFTDPLCTAQVFASKDLDDLCQRIGKINLAVLKQKKAAEEFSSHSQPVFVYIVTKIQNSGGHNRIIQDFIKARPEAQHVILSTELAGRSEADYLLNELKTYGNIVLKLAPKGNYQQRLSWLQKCLLEIHSKKVYLFNHHQDSVAVAAIQPEMEIDGSFYHHGDHHFCLGVYLSHLEHIDPNPAGYHNCRNELGIKNTYVPLTIEDKGPRPATLPFLHDDILTTCTAARSNKVEIPYFVSYLDLIPKLLQATGGKHIHIGRLTPWARYRINRSLKLYNIKPDRFIYSPWVPSIWKALHQYKVDLYIASFPYGGGLTLIEAFGAGIPVAIHKHIFSRILSCIDLGYPNAFNWRRPEELLSFCTTVTADQLNDMSKLARRQFEQFHSSRHLSQFLNGEGNASLKPNFLAQRFTIDADEWALWVTRQSSFKQLIYRLFYRAFRLLRARLK
jgi:hypothetical protein